MNDFTAGWIGGALVSLVTFLLCYILNRAGLNYSEPTSMIGATFGVLIGTFGVYTRLRHRD